MRRVAAVVELDEQRVPGNASAMPSICAIVPYSSSRPWIASTGQRDRRQQVALDVPVAERLGRATTSFQPQNAESTSA